VYERAPENTRGFVWRMEKLCTGSFAWDLENSRVEGSTTTPVVRLGMM
jgi:hypothetical protein